MGLTPSLCRVDFANFNSFHTYTHRFIFGWELLLNCCWNGVNAKINSSRSSAVQSVQINYKSLKAVAFDSDTLHIKFRKVCLQSRTPLLRVRVFQTKHAKYSTKFINFGRHFYLVPLFWKDHNYDNQSNSSTFNSDSHSHEHTAETCIYGNAESGLFERKQKKKQLE